MTFSPRLAALALAATLATPAVAQGVPGSVDPAAVQAGTYATDPAHSLVRWSVSHFGFNPYWGSFGDIEGTLTMDPTNLEGASVDVTIPIGSLVTVSEGLREHMLRPGKDGGDPDFFGPDAADARFVSTRVRLTGPTSAMIRGDFTLNGVTRPIAIAAEFTGVGTNPMSQAETVGFTGRAVIKRSEFGIATFVPMISDEVTLTISAAFERQ